MTVICTLVVSRLCFHSLSFHLLSAPMSLSKVTWRMKDLPSMSLKSKAGSHILCQSWNTSLVQLWKQYALNTKLQEIVMPLMPLQNKICQADKPPEEWRYIMLFISQMVLMGENCKKGTSSRKKAELFNSLFASIFTVQCIKKWMHYKMKIRNTSQNKQENGKRTVIHCRRVQIIRTRLITSQTSEGIGRTQNHWTIAFKDPRAPELKMTRKGPM